MLERRKGANFTQRLKDSVSKFKLSDKVEACVNDNARNI
jgi:hypothetical protein